jgi:hypothetical protein
MNKRGWVAMVLVGAYLAIGGLSVLAWRQVIPSSPTGTPPSRTAAM